MIFTSPRFPSKFSLERLEAEWILARRTREATCYIDIFVARATSKYCEEFSLLHPFSFSSTFVLELVEGPQYFTKEKKRSVCVCALQYMYLKEKCIIDVHVYYTQRRYSRVQ